MTKTMLWRGVLLLLTLGLAAPSPAQTPFRPRIGILPGVAAGKPVAAITINDQPAVSFRSDAGGVSPKDKALTVANRLMQVVANGVKPGQIIPYPMTKTIWTVALNVGGTPQAIAIATQSEADSQGMSSQELARTWVRNIRTLLGQPPFVLSSNRLTIPLGETRTVSVGGAAPAADIALTETDKSVTSSAFDPALRLLTVHGNAPGRSVVAMQTNLNGQATAWVTVDVMKYAAQISPQVDVSVTGIPSAPPEIVEMAAYIGLSRAVDADADAQIRLFNTPNITSALPQGSQMTVRMPVRLTGDRLLAVEAQPSIRITNQQVDLRAAANLFYCNNPEQVKTAQDLFVGGINPFKPARLDYHHQNMGSEPLIYCIDLVNGGTQPAPVHIIAGCCNPGADTVQVGRRAGALFMKAFNSSIGVMTTVPPHGRLPIFAQRFAPGLTVSGIIQVQQMEGQGGTLTMQTRIERVNGNAPPVSRLVQASVGGTAIAAISRADTSLDTNVVPANLISPYVFGAPQVNLTNAYTVGGPWTYVRIGHKESLTDVTGKRFLFGNYGVGYDISITLNNPSTDPRNIGVYFAPDAGSAAGVFQIDGGPILEFNPTYPPNELLLTRYSLAAGETRICQIKTIPLNGSAYPASIIVHSL